MPKQGGGTHVEVCPPWCTTDHTSDTSNPTFLEDVWHQSDVTRTEIELTNDADAPVPWTVLDACLSVIPHSADPASRVPHVAVQFVEEVWTNPLDVNELGQLIDTVAAQLDNLRALQRKLAAARAEWSTAAKGVVA
ncbi:DUF6907 domain-containing protein [Streptomyces smyrnaeus]|uniref:DUF6907 domain-containing protein n=1 Tax=Streptomyces smyrnaeus TaxID=1387713 RepID=UPI003695EB28